MRKFVFFFVCFLLLCGLGCAEVATDVTQECSFAFDYRDTPLKSMTDRDYKTAMESKLVVDPRLDITTGQTPVAGIYIEFGAHRLPFKVYVRQGEDWAKVASCDAAHAQEYVSFPPVSGAIRVKFDSGDTAKYVDIAEIHLYSAGDPHPAVHDWQPSHEKADLMVIVAHPDDELLWLGGAIPYYASVEGKKVTVAYLTCSDPFRELELLNGLWHCGVRNYPVLAGFRDFKPGSTEGVYEDWGRVNINYYLTKLIRAHRPEVIVTHDPEGEYGHPQHIVCSYSVQRAVKYAAQASYGTDEVKALPVWQVKKLYVHLGEQPTTVMNWDVGYVCFNGKSSFTIASEAYAMHISQQAGLTYTMATRGSQYDAYLYTLVHSAVGNDVRGGSFFENISQ